MLILDYKLFGTQSKYVTKTETKQKQTPTKSGTDQVW